MKTFIALVTTILRGRAGVFQTKNKVYIREGGGDTLHNGPPISTLAKEHWPFAWMSVSAYQDDVDPLREKENRRPRPDGCPEAPDAFLESKGWHRWTEIPRLNKVDTDLGQAMQKAHLRAEVWSNQSTNQIVVAFGGTAGGPDWRANFRWFRDSKDGTPDEYTVVTDKFMIAFIDAFRSNLKKGKWMKSAELISTGHSLGGGLAQQFAYALPDESDIPRVKRVYSFDPTPVSGKRSVPNYWMSNAQGLHIFRIYNRGEGLAGLRALENVYEFPSVENPKVTDYRYQVGWNLFSAATLTDIVRWHNMLDLACAMRLKAGA